jgi:hypothetical protein
MADDEKPGIAMIPGGMDGRIPPSRYPRRERLPRDSHDQVAFHSFQSGAPGFDEGSLSEGVDSAHDSVGRVVEGPDGGRTEEIGTGTDLLQTFFEVGSCFVGGERFHDDGRGDGVGEGLEEAEAQAGQEFLLSAQDDAHAGFAVVLEVEELPEFDEDVIGQAVSLVDDENGMDLVRAVKGDDMVLDSAEECCAPSAGLEGEGRGEVSVELGERDGGMAEIDRLVEADGKGGHEEPQEAGLAGPGLADEDADTATLAEEGEGREGFLDAGETQESRRIEVAGEGICCHAEVRKHVDEVVGHVIPL